MRTGCLLIVFHILAMLPIMAQSQKEKTVLKQKRFKKVDYYHVGVGIESGINENWYIEPLIFGGIGSYRNLLNVDIGIGYQLINPLGSSEKERIVLHQLPVFASLHINLAHWPSGAVYIGGEGIYNLTVKGQHVVPNADLAETDNKLGHSHATAVGMLGVRLNQWDFSLRYAYDLAPGMNQKYVFESPSYDYDYLHASLFEHSRLALNISYLIPF